MKEKLVKGQIFKNYNKVCEWLGVNPTKGKGRQYHIREFERYCIYHNEGNKYIVDEVFEIPLDKIDNRVNNKGGNNNKYSDLMDNVIIDLLKKECIMDSRTKIFCEHIPLFKKTEYTGYYSRSLEGLSTYYKTTKNLVKTYYNKMLDMTTKCFDRSLERLQKQGIINYEIGITTMTYIGEMDYLSPKDKLFKKIKEYEKETYKEMEITPYHKIIDRNNNINFKEIMKEKLIDTTIQQRDNISSYWNTYNIELAYNADEIIDLDNIQPDIEELRKQLIISLHEAIINTPVHGKTQYDQPKFIKDILYIDNKVWVDANKLIDDVNIGFTLEYYNLKTKNNKSEDNNISSTNNKIKEFKPVGKVYKDENYFDEVIPF